VGVKQIYVWVPWGCYVPECAFSGMSKAARHLGVSRSNIIDHMTRNGFYKNDQGHLFKIEMHKNELRKGIEKNFNNKSK